MHATSTTGRSVGFHRRAALLIKNAARDVAARPRWKREPAAPIRDGARDAAIRWLVSTHDVTGRRGSSKGIHLLRGWFPAFPETTGYVIGTLLEEARRRPNPDLVQRAREMGDWEIEVQNEDGGVMEGLMPHGERSIAFNTGMVMHGWIDLYEELGDEAHLDAARRANDFLVRTMDADGAWRDSAYLRIPTTYHSRVAWAMVRLGLTVGDDAIVAAGVRNLDWTLAQQQENGWFANCAFKPGGLPNTHGIAYTLRGLLESGLMLGDDRYLRAARLTSEQLIGRLEDLGTLPAHFDESWRGRAWFVCLTGLVQLGDVWLKLSQLEGDERYASAGRRAIAQAATRQERLDGPAAGALPGSYPIFGLYSPLQYLNWATKFLADALLTLEGAQDESG